MRANIRRAILLTVFIFGGLLLANTVGLPTALIVASAIAVATRLIVGVKAVLSHR